MMSSSRSQGSPFIGAISSMNMSTRCIRGCDQSADPLTCFLTASKISCDWFRRSRCAAARASPVSSRKVEIVKFERGVWGENLFDPSPGVDSDVTVTSRASLSSPPAGSLPLSDFFARHRAVRSAALDRAGFVSGCTTTAASISEIAATRASPVTPAASRCFKVVAMGPISVLPRQACCGPSSCGPSDSRRPDGRISSGRGGSPIR